MFNDDDTDDRFFCPDCHEYAVVGADHCPDCHAGRCAICGELIAKDAPAVAGSSNDVFCEACDRLVAEESVGEIAERLATPEHVEEDASAKTLVEPYESTAAVSAGWLARLAQAAAVVSLLLAAVAAQGCAAHAPAPEVESVGQLTAGPSVRSAPVAHDEPPQLGEIVDTGSDDAGSVVETTTRVEARARDEQAYLLARCKEAARPTPDTASAGVGAK